MIATYAANESVFSIQDHVMNSRTYLKEFLSERHTLPLALKLTTEQIATSDEIHSTGFSGFQARSDRCRMETVWDGCRLGVCAGYKSVGAGKIFDIPLSVGQGVYKICGKGVDKNFNMHRALLGPNHKREVFQLSFNWKLG